MSEHIIKIEDANIFQSGGLVLSKVNLTINKGQFSYLVGKTGSGKSSLLKTLYADLELTTGKAEVLGYKIHEIKEKEIPFLRRKIGVVFQDFQLLTDRTITENLYFVLKATGWKDKVKMNARIIEVLTKVGMKTKGFKMPYQLSGGEQQRIAIARALLNDPELIIADEPTGNLDPKTSEEIMDLLKQISNNGRAILMATHDYSLILKYPASMLKCDDGKIFEIESGTF
ncbi:MAG: ATP-binding cassette domain-containing protein [Flavobacteriales bacterium]|nr:ATP-binding cassette domain-containing protein [Flavobacteriales bacterium]